MSRERLTELFDRAIDIAPERRAAWLDAQCGEDSAMCARLERLLRADAQAHDFLETPPDWVTDTLATSARMAETIPPIAFGPWRVVRSIGVGGMGEVWLAERADGEFEQRVAIKQLAYPTPGLLARFRQERQILARLEHPNIARLIDGGVDTHGAPYLAMEYVEGVPIIAWAQQLGLDTRARLQLFLRVCAAVQYAHQNLIVHRDLKPSNIFVTAEGEPKLLDFGIAKVLATTGAAAPTQTVARLLTPGYAAPEQFHGGPITTATDAYALGVVLYELLTGMRPASNRVTGDAGIGATDPLPPSAAIERTTGNAPARRRLLRGDLDRIVLTALAADPARRYPSAAALAADIRSWLGGRPIAARGDDAAYRLRKFARRNRPALGAAALVLLVCVVATTISLQQAHRARQQADAATRQAARADAAKQFLTGVFDQTSPNENQGKPFTAHDLLQRGERQLAELNGRPALQMELTSLLATLYWNSGDDAHATTLFDSVMGDLPNPDIPPQVKARVLADRARMETEKSQFAQALAHARQALALAQQAGTEGSGEAFSARRAINDTLAWQRDSVHAERELRATLDNDRAAFGDVHDTVAEDWELLGLALADLGRYDEATQALEKAIAILRELHGGAYNRLAKALNSYGLVLREGNDLPGAEAALRECTDLVAKLFGTDSYITRAARANLLTVHELQGRFAEVLPERLQQLAAEQATAGGGRTHRLANTHASIGIDLRELGRFDEAEHALRTSLALLAEIPGTNDGAGQAAARLQLGLTLQLQGRFAEAEAALRETLRIEQRSAAPSSPRLNVARGELGNQLRLAHRNDEALRELSAANAAFREIGTGAAARQSLVQANLSQAELDNGDSATAETTASDALAIARKALPAANYRLGTPLFALARAKLAMEKADEAEPLLREALAVRGRVHPAQDPRVLEVKVELIHALQALGRPVEAQALTTAIEPLLQPASSAWIAELRTRLQSPASP